MSDLESLEPTPPELNALLARRGRQDLDDDARQVILASVARSTTASRPLTRRQWTRVAAVAAALSIVVLAAAGIANLQPGQPPTSAPAPTPVPSSAAPSAIPGLTATLLSIDQLRLAIAAVKGSGTSEDVLVDADLDFASVRNQFGVLCASGSPCPVARLTRATDLLVHLVPGSALWTLITETPQDSLQGPVAIRIDPDGNLEWLGMLWEGSGSPTWSASASTVQSLEASPLWTVIAVHGWLGWSGQVPCAPPLPPTPPPDTPFDSCPGGWVASAPSIPDAIGPPGFFSAPDDAIRVNSTAIDQYAGGADTSEGTFLLRLVEDPRPNANPKRGWQVVGLITASGAGPTPSPAPSSGLGEPAVRSAGEMSDLLRTNGNAWIGHVMLLDGTLVQMGGPPCTADPADCPIGAFDGSDELVYASDESVRASVAGGSTGTFVVRVRDSGLELLGQVDLNDKGGPLRLATATALGTVGGDVLVNGWLTATAYPCPPAPITDQDTPFYYCADSWITADAVPQSEYERGDPGFLDVDGIPVQPSAFVAFATGATHGPGLSVRGIYVLHPVTAPNGTQCSPCSAWRVVARVDADPAAPSTSPAPLTSDATVLSLDQLRATIAGHQGARLQPLDVIADVSIDRSTGVQGIDCPDNFEACDEIGTIHGAADLGTVLRREDPDVQVSDDVVAPIGLRINDHGQLIFLGHVNVNPTDSSVAWTVPEAAAAADQLPENELVAVGGWLAGNLSTCGPALFPPASPPAWDPFQCYGAHYLEAQPEQLYGVGGSSSSVPTGPSLKLGVNQYAWYAPDPAPNLAPRHGVYLVKSVVNHSSLESQACTGCRGWLVVGRLEPSAQAGPSTTGPSPSPSASFAASGSP